MLLLQLFSLLLFHHSLAYREGAPRESCYDHNIEHTRLGRRVPVIRCTGYCNFDVEVVDEVDIDDVMEYDDEPLILDDNVTSLTCNSVYRCKIHIGPDLMFILT